MAELIGTEGRDVLYGGEADDIGFGYGGDDFINPQGGDDTVDGGDGDDALAGGSGADLLEGAAGDDELSDQYDDDAPDKLDGGAGADILTGNSGDSLIGGAGFDTAHLDLNQSGLALRADLRGLDRGEKVELADGTLLRGIEGGSIHLGYASDWLRLADSVAMKVVAYWGDDTVIGSNGDDWLDGANGKDRLVGRGGDDRLEDSGFPAGDTLNGGEGADTLVGGWGDQYLGGRGHDEIELWQVGGPVDLDFEAAAHGAVTLADGTLLRSVEGGYISLSDWADDVTGYRDSVTLQGNGGDDILVGGRSADHLAGDGGADTVRGGGGADTIMSNDGDDVLSGGRGADRFVLIAHPTPAGITITDLEDHDILDISINAWAGDFEIVTEFSGGGSEARLEYFADDDRTLLQIDGDGDMQSDLDVWLLGDHRDHASWVL